MVMDTASALPASPTAVAATGQALAFTAGALALGPAPGAGGTDSPATEWPWLIMDTGARVIDQTSLAGLQAERLVRQWSGESQDFAASERSDSYLGALRQDVRAMGMHAMIRGMQNTGTNAVHNLLTSSGAGAPAVKVLSYEPDRGRLEIWRRGRRGHPRTAHAQDILAPFACAKHTPLRLVPQVVQPRPVQLAITPIVVLRHPLLWLSGMVKMHYEVSCQSWCGLEACDHVGAPHWYWFCAMPVVRDRHARLEDMWVEWAQATEDFQEPHVLVRYEDVLMAPGETLCALRRALGFTTADACLEPGAPGVRTALNKPAKAHGSASGIDAARQTLRHLSDNPNALLDKLRGPCLAAGPPGSNATSGTAGSAGDVGRPEEVLRRIGANDRLQALCERFGYRCNTTAYILRRRR